jgi:hypothetical protein
MGQLVSSAVLHQQMPADESRQTRAVLEAIMSEHGATRFKFDACEEITHLLKWSAVLQRETHQAGDDVVETDELRRTVRAFDSKVDFCRLFVVVDAEVEGALAGDLDLLGDVVSAAGKNKSLAHVGVSVSGEAGSTGLS